MQQPRTWLGLCFVLATGFIISGCATQTRQLSDDHAGLPLRAELSATPFFAQEQHQCGPAALATALVAAGYRTDPRQLEAQVYVPAREGSLQPEMLAAARRQGALAVTSAKTLAGLFTEVAAGTPVIVLQNLGLAIAPRWHYAVVVGFDLARGEVLLRSGLREREVMSMSTFEHTWARAGYWSMAVFGAGALPVSVEREVLEKTLTRLEKFAAQAALLAWYEQAHHRWPESLIFTIGLGNAAYATGQWAQAERTFRSAAAHFPQSGVALNNLAMVLQQRGQLEEALLVAERAVALKGEWQVPAVATRDAIRLAIQLAGSRAPSVRSESQAAE